MTTVGWLIMIVSNVGVLGLTAFCLVRVFQMPAEEAEDTLRTELEIDTGDTDEP